MALPGKMPYRPFLVMVKPSKEPPLYIPQDCLLKECNYPTDGLPVAFLSKNTSQTYSSSSRRRLKALFQCLFIALIVLLLSYVIYYLLVSCWWTPERNTSFSQIFSLTLDWSEVTRWWTVINTGTVLMAGSAVKFPRVEFPLRTHSELPQVTITNRSQIAARRLPEALIIGVKKGGTRALLEYIRLHPQVRAPGAEMHFFDRHYERGIDWYRNQMPLTHPSQITIEKTPSYFVTRDAPHRIYKLNKKMKLIIVVRDPITRAISDYTQARSKGRSSRSFHEMAFYSNGSHRLVDTSWGALRIGLYAQHLAKWRKYFPAEQMLFVSGERLITDPAGEMARVQEFLGMDNHVREENFYFDPVKGFPCLKRPDTQLRGRCLGKSKGRRHPSIPEDVIAQLRDFYKPFNEKFYTMVEQDFQWL